MNRFIAKMFLVAAVLGVALTLSTSTATAQTTDILVGGHTNVNLSSTFVNALESLDVTPGTVYPTYLREGVVNFPVTSGAIELDNAAGQILHSGGLTLTAGETTVVLDSFIIDTTGSAPVITGVVVANGTLLGRVTLFDLALPAGLTLPLKPKCGVLNLNGVGVTLDATAAGALNSIFDVDAFTSGFPIGTAVVVADLPTNPCGWGR